MAHILEGTIQKSADQVRVNVQLINAQNDSHLWADKYNHRVGRICCNRKRNRGQNRRHFAGEIEQRRAKGHATRAPLKVPKRINFTCAVVTSWKNEHRPI